MDLLVPIGGVPLWDVVVQLLLLIAVLFLLALLPPHRKQKRSGSKSLDAGEAQASIMHRLRELDQKVDKIGELHRKVNELNDTLHKLQVRPTSLDSYDYRNSQHAASISRGQQPNPDPRPQQSASPQHVPPGSAPPKSPSFPTPSTQSPRLQSPRAPTLQEQAYPEQTFPELPQFEAGRLPEREPKPKEYYASAPEVDGTFKVNQLSEESRYDSLYRLTVKSDNMAELSLVQNKNQFPAAIQAASRYLDPACNYAHLPSASAATIQELRRGEVLLEDTRWRVQHKLEIEFR